MRLFLAVCYLLVAVALAVLAWMLLFWGLAYLGIHIPDFIPKIIGFIFGICVLIYAVGLFTPMVNGGAWSIWPPRPPGT